MTEANEREFLVLTTKLLLKSIEEGRVKLIEERVPETVRAIKALRFDEAGNPIFESITGPVRALANLVYTHEVEVLEQEAEERERASRVHELLTPPVEINEKVFASCVKHSDFTRLAFDLCKETGAVLAVASHSYLAEEPGEGVFDRNQAICAGLLVRITKFLLSVIQLVATAEDERGDVVLALNRCIGETAVNLRFLAEKHEARFYDQFVKFSLAPERELYDLIQRNIKARNGEILSVERRMLNSIERVCKASCVEIGAVDPKHRDWGGGLRNRLEAIGLGEGYVGIQRIPSHAVHGTWVDLCLHHLEVKGDRFAPDPTWSRVDPRLLTPMCVLVLSAAGAYLERFFGNMPELRPLYRRADDLEKRLRMLDRAHEEWFGRQRTNRSEETERQT